MSLPVTGIPAGTYDPKRWQPQKMVWWYWALMDEMILHPEWNKKDFAKRFNVSEMCIILVTNSDVFQSYLAERRRGNSEHLDLVIRHRMTKVATKALDVVEKILDKKQDSIPLPEATTLVDKTLERLGYGTKVGPNVVVNNNNSQQVVVPVSLQALEDARAALRRNEIGKLNAPEESNDVRHTTDIDPGRAESPNRIQSVGRLDGGFDQTAIGTIDRSVRAIEIEGPTAGVPCADEL